MNVLRQLDTQLDLFREFDAATAGWDTASEVPLKPTSALLSIVTLTLLAMRDTSRQPDAKRRQAMEIISIEYVEILSSWRHGRDVAKLKAFAPSY